MHVYFSSHTKTQAEFTFIFWFYPSCHSLISRISALKFPAALLALNSVLCYFEPVRLWFSAFGTGRWGGVGKDL